CPPPSNITAGIFEGNRHHITVHREPCEHRCSSPCSGRFLLGCCDFDHLEERWRRATQNYRLQVVEVEMTSEILLSIGPT
uniref:Uncharacterized protein n=1 Tax=Gasterosteus aculeatus TaxID=69293 RepID=G3P7I8_GASAC